MFNIDKIKKKNASNFQGKMLYTKICWLIALDEKLR
jgi:hypothetical protein